MQIREYLPSDCKQILTLFYETVHAINSRDYTKQQIDVWANGQIDEKVWNASFLMHYTLVAMQGNDIVGFGDIDETGYLDHLYVHKEYQRQGIASTICEQLEKHCQTVFITTHASITAVAFFKKRGYQIEKKQEVIRQGIALTNYVMKKKMQ